MAWIERGRSGLQKCGSVCDNMRLGLCKWLGRMDGLDLGVGSGSLGVKEVSMGEDECVLVRKTERRKIWL